MGQGKAGFRGSGAKTISITTYPQVVQGRWLKSESGSGSLIHGTFRTLAVGFLFHM